MKERILVTGASGTVGREVLKQLFKKEKYEITAFDIESAKSKKVLLPYKDKIRIIYGDITRKENIAKAVSGQDKIIHLAAIIPPLADEQPQLAEAVNINGTQHILDTMKDDAFLLYASSVSVYGDRVKNPMILTSDKLNPSPKDEYALTKIATEKRIQESGKKWTIFRLSAIMGYGNHKISPIMFHMPLETSLEITTPEDTARAFVNGLETEQQLKGKIFNLGGGLANRTTYKSFLESSFKAFGLGKVDFPQHSFAEKNFHCGYYADGDELEHILHFRNDNLDSYFAKLQQSASPTKRVLARIFRGFIKRYLLSKSEPYQAYKTNDQTLISHYFNV